MGTHRSLLKPGQLPPMVPWTGAPAEHAEAAVPPHLRGRARRLCLAMLAIAVVGGGAVAMIFSDRKRNAQVSRLTHALAAAAPLPRTTPTAPLQAPTPPRQLPRESRLGLKETEALVQGLTLNLLSADTDSQRLACIAHPNRHRPTLQAFFAAQSIPLKLQAVRALPVAVTALPGSSPVILCEVRTNLSTRSTAIVRLLTSDDGSLKLDWPLLLDSLENRLATYAAQPSTQPRWVTAGLKRNFGFHLPADLRATHHIFDIQVTGNGADRMVVMVLKDSPTGRAFDSALAWSDLYIVRTLLHWTEIAGEPKLTILDGEWIETSF